MSKFNSDDYLNRDLNRHYDEIERARNLDDQAISHVKEIIEDNLESYYEDKELEIVEELMDYEGISNEDFNLFKQEYQLKITTKVRVEKI